MVRFAADNVSVSLDATLTGPEATVELQLQNGTTLATRCTHTRGSPENPLTTEQVQAKFRRYAADRLSSSQIDGVIQAVAQLETIGSVRDLTKMLRR